MTYASPTTINASRGFIEILNYVNGVTDNWVSNMLLVAIYVIILMGFYKARDDFLSAFAVAGYGTFVFSLFFWAGGLVTGWALGVVIGLAVIGTIALLMDSGGNG